MPDGDIIKLGILPTFSKVYKQICELSGCPTDWAREVARGVKSSIRNYGPVPVRLIQIIAAEFARSLDNNPNLTLEAWIELDRKINHIQRTVRGRREPIDLAIKSCRQILVEIDHGEIPANIYQGIMQRFVCLVYETRFLERVNAVVDHWDQVGPNIIQQRITVLEPEVRPILLRLAVQLSCNQRMRIIQRRGLKPKITANTNLI